MKIGIIGAMKIEINLILERMKTYEIIEKSGFIFYVGEKIVLTSCSVGKVNAAACTQVLIDNFEVSAVINTGIAGGIATNIEIGDIVLSTSCTYHDVRPEQMRHFFPYQEEFTSDENLIKLAQKSFETLTTNANLHLGKVITGDSFISDTELKRQLIAEYSPACVEMEGAAIAHVAYINQVPFLIIRAISDKADAQASVNYEEFEEKAAHLSADLVWEMVKK